MDRPSLALETGHHPALLKDAVTTPAGCTIEGLMELEKGGLRVTLMNAVIKTTIRAQGVDDELKAYLLLVLGTWLAFGISADAMQRDDRLQS